MTAARAFFTAMAFPLAVGGMLAVALATLEPRSPVVALLVNVFLLFEVAGFAQAMTMPVPASYFRLRRLEQPRLYERAGIRVFQRLMRSRLYHRINPGFVLSGGRTATTDFGSSDLGVTRDNRAIAAVPPR